MALKLVLDRKLAVEKYLVYAEASNSRLRVFIPNEGGEPNSLTLSGDDIREFAVAREYPRKIKNPFLVWSQEENWDDVTLKFIIGKVNEGVGFSFWWWRSHGRFEPISKYCEFISLDRYSRLNGPGQRKPLPNWPDLTVAERFDRIGGFNFVMAPNAKVEAVGDQLAVSRSPSAPFFPGAAAFGWGKEQYTILEYQIDLRSGRLSFKLDPTKHAQPGVVFYRSQSSQTFPLFENLPPIETTFDPLSPNGFEMRFQASRHYLSWFRSRTGRKVTLKPLDGAGFILLPGLNNEYQLAPKGTFLLGLSDIGGEFAMLAGSRSSETVHVKSEAASGSILMFVPGKPALVDNGDLRESLMTSWASLSNAKYYSHPEDAPFFDRPLDGLMSFRDISVKALSDVAVFPLVPYAGNWGNLVNRQFDLDGTVLLPKRKSILKVDSTGLVENIGRYISPHGVLLDSKDGDGLTLDLGRTGSNRTSVKSPSPLRINFNKAAKAKISEVLSQRQVFMVATQMGGLGNGELQLDVAGWSFRVDLAKNSRSVFLLKLHDQPLSSLIDDLSTWSLRADLVGNDAAANNIKQKLKSSLKDLPLAVQGADWKGVLLIDVPVPYASLPLELKPLAIGLGDSLAATYLGVDINRAKTTNGIVDIEESLVFGSIDFSGGKFARGGGFGLRVDTLGIKFENSKVVDFKCRVSILLGSLFQDSIAGTDEAKTIGLEGFHVKKQGRDAYELSLANPKTLNIQSSVLKSVKISRASLTPDINGEQTIARFGLSGALIFNQAISSLFAEDLMFSNACVVMSFKVDGDGGVNSLSFKFDARDLCVSVDQHPKSGAFLQQFGFKLRGVSIGKSTNLASEGYVALLGNATCTNALYFSFSIGRFGALSDSSGDTALSAIVGWSAANSQPVFGIRFPLARRGFAVQGLAGLEFSSLKLDQGGRRLLLSTPSLNFFGRKLESQSGFLEAYLEGNDGKISWFARHTGNDNWAVGKNLNWPGASGDIETVLNQVWNSQPSPGASQWTFAFQKKGLVDLGLVLMDPNLFALKLKTGPKSFLVGYRKLSDGLGVFSGQLDFDGKLNLGSMKVRPPVTSVDIYTNGDYRVDIGYPQGPDYSRCFEIRLGILTGRAGLFVAKGNSIAPGGWSVKTVLGVGFAGYLGYTTEGGGGPLMLRAELGAYAALAGHFGYLEGSSLDNPDKVLFEGKIGIQVTLAGHVDLLIIKASIYAQLDANAGFLYDGRSTRIQFEASVRVSGSIVVGRFFGKALRKSYSFSRKVSFDDRFKSLASANARMTKKMSVVSNELIPLADPLQLYWDILVSKDDDGIWVTPVLLIGDKEFFRLWNAVGEWKSRYENYTGLTFESSFPSDFSAIACYEVLRELLKTSFGKIEISDLPTNPSLELSVFPMPPWLELQVAEESIGLGPIGNLGNDTRARLNKLFDDFLESDLSTTSVAHRDEKVSLATLMFENYFESLMKSKDGNPAAVSQPLLSGLRVWWNDDGASFPVYRVNGAAYDPKEPDRISGQQFPLSGETEIKLGNSGDSLFDLRGISSVKCNPKGLDIQRQTLSAPVLLSPFSRAKRVASLQSERQLSKNKHNDKFILTVPVVPMAAGGMEFDSPPDGLRLALTIGFYLSPENELAPTDGGGTERLRLLLNLARKALVGSPLDFYILREGDNTANYNQLSEAVLRRKNLSILTNPIKLLKSRPTNIVDFATQQETLEFLQLLLECCERNCGGYYLEGKENGEAITSGDFKLYCLWPEGHNVLYPFHDRAEYTQSTARLTAKSIDDKYAVIVANQNYDQVLFEVQGASRLVEDTLLPVEFRLLEVGYQLSQRLEQRPLDRVLAVPPFIEKDDEGVLENRYRIALRLRRGENKDYTNSPYELVGQNITLKYALRDELGVRDAKTMSISTATIQYTDHLIALDGWPGVEAKYSVDPIHKKITVTMTRQNPTEQVDEKIIEQLEDDNLRIFLDLTGSVFQLDKAELLSFIKRQDGIPKFCFISEKINLSTENIRPWNVSIRLQRPEEYFDEAFKAVAKISTPLRPSDDLKTVAEELQSFGECLIAFSESSNNSIWLLPKSIASDRFRGSNLDTYAPRPISNVLWSGPDDLTDIDLDLALRRVLDKIEIALGKKDLSREDFQTLATVKRTIANKLSEFLVSTRRESCDCPLSQTLFQERLLSDLTSYYSLDLVASAKLENFIQPGGVKSLVGSVLDQDTGTNRSSDAGLTGRVFIDDQDAFFVATIDLPAGQIDYNVTMKFRIEFIEYEYEQAKDWLRLVKPVEFLIGDIRQRAPLREFPHFKTFAQSGGPLDTPRPDLSPLENALLWRHKVDAEGMMASDTLVVTRRTGPEREFAKATVDFPEVLARFDRKYSSLPLDNDNIWKNFLVDLIALSKIAFNHPDAGPGTDDRESATKDFHILQVSEVSTTATLIRNSGLPRAFQYVQSLESAGTYRHRVKFEQPIVMGGQRSLQNHLKEMLKSFSGSQEIQLRVIHLVDAKEPERLPGSPSFLEPVIINQIFLKAPGKLDVEVFSKSLSNSLVSWKNSAKPSPHGALSFSIECFPNEGPAICSVTDIRIPWTAITGW